MASRIESFLAQVSHARGTPRADSDVDLIIVTSVPLTYVNDTPWTEVFGTPLRHELEHYEPVQSVRVHYVDGLEVEFAFAPVTWAEIEPLDSGTAEVVSGQMAILVDKSDRLKALQHVVSQASHQVH